MRFFRKLISTLKEGVKEGYTGEVIDPIIPELIAKIKKNGECVRFVTKNNSITKSVFLNGIHYHMFSDELSIDTHSAVFYSTLEDKTWRHLPLEGNHVLASFLVSFMSEKAKEELEIHRMENRQEYIDIAEANAKSHGGRDDV